MLSSDSLLVTPHINKRYQAILFIPCHDPGGFQHPCGKAISDSLSSKKYEPKLNLNFVIRHNFIFYKFCDLNIPVCYSTMLFHFVHNDNWAPKCSKFSQLLSFKNLTEPQHCLAILQLFSLVRSFWATCDKNFNHIGNFWVPSHSNLGLSQYNPHHLPFYILLWYFPTPLLSLNYARQSAPCLPGNLRTHLLGSTLSLFPYYIFCVSPKELALVQQNILTVIKYGHLSNYILSQTPTPQDPLVGCRSSITRDILITFISFMSSIVPGIL